MQNKTKIIIFIISHLLAVGLGILIITLGFRGSSRDYQRLENHLESAESKVNTFGVGLSGAGEEVSGIQADLETTDREIAEIDYQRETYIKYVTNAIDRNGDIVSELREGNRACEDRILRIEEILSKSKD